MRVLAGKPANGKGVRRCKLRGYMVRITHVFRPTGAGAASSYTCPLVVMVLQWAPLAKWDDRLTWVVEEWAPGCAFWQGTFRCKRAFAYLGS